MSNPFLIDLISAVINFLASNKSAIVNKAKNFDNTKFKIEVTQFTLQDSSEIKAITEISYDKHDISWDLLYSNFNGDGDLPDLQVKNI